MANTSAAGHMGHSKTKMPADFSKWAFGRPNQPHISSSKGHSRPSHPTTFSQLEGRESTVPSKAHRIISPGTLRTQPSDDEDIHERNTGELDNDGNSKDTEDASRKRIAEEAGFSEEVCALCDDLYGRCQTDSPPTVSQYKRFTVDALSALLRFNDRPSYNLDKSALMRMVRDYMMNGCPPRCPTCTHGFLKFSNGQKRYGRRYYWCPGSTSDGTHFLGCGYRDKDCSQTTRIPWRCPEPGSVVSKRHCGEGHESHDQA